MSEKFVPKQKLTTRDIHILAIRHCWSRQYGWNYTTMQAIGYCWSLMDTLKKLYGEGSEDYHKAIGVHLMFYNTQPHMGSIIAGANIALEEEIGMTNPDAVIGLKAGLMGPFAGIGDTVLITIYRTIFWSMAAQMAIAGNYGAALMPLVTSLPRLALSYWFIFLGYGQAKKIATSIATDIKDLTEGACILGLVVVGAMTASVVTPRMAIQIVVGNNPDGSVVRQSLQTMVDGIVPSLLSLLVVLSSYWLLNQKWMSPVKLLLTLFAGGIILHNIGFLV